MPTTSQCFIYSFFFLTSILSIYNYIRYEEANYGRYKDSGESQPRFDPIARNRRDVSSDADHISSLINAVRYENETLIREEISKIVVDVLQNLPEENLCQIIRRCNYTGRVGPKGPPGESGPPGKDGKRGLGLFFPQLRNKRLNPIANESDDKVLACRFFGNPLPAVTWETHLDGTNVTFEIDQNKSVITSYLHVKNITWDDRGNVTCIAESILGTANATGYLTVHAAPIITLPTGPVYANLGSTFEFPECKVVADPQAIISWRRGYGKLPIGRYEKNERYLRILDVQVIDEGYYVCEAENYLGRAVRSIQFKTKELTFSQRPTYFMQVIESYAVINCSAFGRSQNMSGKIVFLNRKTEVPFNTSKTTNSFTVFAEIKEPGIYKCVIEEFQKKIETSFSLIFLELQSSILTADGLKYLATYLLEESAVGKYSLCWKATRDGWSPSEFHKRCDGKPNTISIFKSDDGKVFGGYSDVAWSSSFSLTTSSVAFIFTLGSSRGKVLIKKDSTALCYDTGYAPCFGKKELYTTSYADYGSYPHYGSTTRYNMFKSGLGTSFGSSVYIPSSGKLSELEVFYKI